MSSLSKNNRNGYRITFTSLADKSKQTVIYLGIMPIKVASRIHNEVDVIIANKKAAQPLPAVTADWLSRIDDKLHTKLFTAGLIPERQKAVTLGQFIDGFIKEHSGEWKEGSRLAWVSPARTIKAYFGELTPIKKIDIDAAVNFRLELEKHLAEATVPRMIKCSKQIFNLARRRKLITDSPFETIRAGSQSNPARRHFITMEMYYKLLEGCLNAKQRLWLTLMRVGGLRCPSELCGLRWSEINYTEKWFWVHSPKTERHAGKDKRKVPLFPLIEKYLTEYGETLPEGAPDEVFPNQSKTKSLAVWLHQTARRAGVQLCEKPVQNCRYSRASELRETFPEYLVNAWLGHTQAVAEKHYVSIRDEVFLRLFGRKRKNYWWYEIAHSRRPFGEAR